MQQIKLATNQEEAINGLEEAVKTLGEAKKIFLSSLPTVDATKMPKEALALLSGFNYLGEQLAKTLAEQKRAHARQLERLFWGG